MTSSVKATVKRKSIIMEYAGPWIVKITYFKASGKYYSEGEIHFFETCSLRNLA